MSRRPRKGMRPGTALLLLAGAGTVFAYNVLPMLHGRSAPAAPAGTVVGSGTGEPVRPGTEPREASWHDADLLARFGSYQRGTPVPPVFGLPANGGTAAAPAAETRLVPANGTHAPGWQGQDPPQLQVAFVMVGGPVARAVVDGRVVGIGDRITAGTVKSITAGGIEVHDGVRLLHYGLDKGWPREFREELARRAAAATVPPAATANGTKEQGGGR